MALAALSLLPACKGKSGWAGAGLKVWGREGLRDGSFLKPRGIGVKGDEIYAVDTTGRVQVFALDGKFLRKWTVPEIENGSPTSVAFDRKGNILLPDTHYSRILEYTPKGELIKMWGTYGNGNDEFIYPTDIAQGKDGAYYISEYGMGAERVHVFDAQRRYVRLWGGHGEAHGQFNRAMAIAMDEQNILYVVDTANHRVQCFDTEGKFIKAFGEPGTDPGKLKYPSDIALTPDGSVILCEYGAHRISRFDKNGRFIACYGKAGRKPGEFNGPRGIAASGDGILFIADTDNHRIQRLEAEALS